MDQELHLPRRHAACDDHPSGGSEQVEFNHPDRLGTRLKTNQSAGTSYEQAHLPFGTALNAESTLTTNNKRFTSYDRSTSTGLDYSINRIYDGKLGRFTQGSTCLDELERRTRVGVWLCVGSGTHSILQTDSEHQLESN